MYQCGAFRLCLPSLGHFHWEKSIHFLRQDIAKPISESIEWDNHRYLLHCPSVTSFLVDDKPEQRYGGHESDWLRKCVEEQYSLPFLAFLYCSYSICDVSLFRSPFCCGPLPVLRLVMQIRLRLVVQKRLIILLRELYRPEGSWGRFWRMCFFVLCDSVHWFLFL